MALIAHISSTFCSFLGEKLGRVEEGAIGTSCIKNKNQNIQLFLGRERLEVGEGVKLSKGGPFIIQNIQAMAIALIAHISSTFFHFCENSMDRGVGKWTRIESKRGRERLFSLVFSYSKQWLSLGIWKGIESERGRERERHKSREGSISTSL